MSGYNLPLAKIFYYGILVICGNAYMILPVFNFNINQKSDINFNGLKLPPAREIKNIDRLCCPRCGGPIMAPEKLISAYRAISLPLKSIIRLGFLKRTEEIPNIWSVVANFAKKYPKLPLDKILENEENHDVFRKAIEETIAPNVDRKNNKEYEKRLKDFDSMEYMIRKASRARLRSSSVVIKRLKPLLSYLKQVEKTIPYKLEVQSRIRAFEELMYFSELYPKKCISEILDDPAIQQYVTVMNNGTENGRRYKQKVYYNMIKETVRKKTNCSKTKANEFIDNVKAMFMTGDVDIGARAYRTKAYIRSFLAERNALNIYPEIEKILGKIPETLQNEYSILESCLGRKNDSKIIDIIVKSFSGTTEHVFARSTGGGKYRSNEIAMHKICNYRRANTSYKDETLFYPDFAKNMCRQISQASKYILEGKMAQNDKYVLYPPQIKETLLRASEGIINPHVADYCMKEIPKIEQKNRIMQKEVNRKNFERNALIQKLHKCVNDQDKKTIRDEIEKINTEQKLLLAELKNIRYYYNSLKGYLKNELNNHQKLPDNL